MNLTTILLAGGTLGLCIIPFILMIRSNIERENKLLQSLQTISSINNCKITLHEISGDLAIGLAEHDNAIVFFKQGKEKETQRFISLAPFRSCKINNQGRTIKSSDDNYRITEKLELLFEPQEKNGTPIALEFYSRNDSFQLNGELQLIEKWEALINTYMKKDKAEKKIIKQLKTDPQLALVIPTSFL